MTQIVNYEHNTFYINELLNTVRIACTSSIDTSLFLDKLVEDIFFIDSSLEQLANSLRERRFQKDFREAARYLGLTKLRFAGLLEEICRGETDTVRSLEPFFPKFQACIEHHRKETGELQSEMGSADPAAQESDLISSQEYQFLFHQDTEET